MVKIFGWYCFFRLHINRNRMALICSDQGFIFIESKSLFVIDLDYLIQHLHSQRVCFADTLYQFINICPTMLIELDIYCFRLMPKDECNISACFCKTHFIPFLNFIV